MVAARGDASALELGGDLLGFCSRQSVDHSGASRMELAVFALKAFHFLHHLCHQLCLALRDHHQLQILAIKLLPEDQKLSWPALRDAFGFSEAKEFVEIFRHFQRRRRRDQRQWDIVESRIENVAHLSIRRPAEQCLFSLENLQLRDS